MSDTSLRSGPRFARIVCRVRHKWAEKSRVVWKTDGLTEGSCIEACRRCGERRRRFLSAEGPSPKESEA